MKLLKLLIPHCGKCNGIFYYLFFYLFILFWLFYLELDFENDHIYFLNSVVVSFLPVGVAHAFQRWLDSIMFLQKWLNHKDIFIYSSVVIFNHFLKLNQHV